MTDRDRGPLSEYGVVWRDGRAEIIKAHQVLLPHDGLFDDMFGRAPKPRRLTFHGEIDGRWQLILDVDYDQVQSVRLLTAQSEVPDD